MKRIVNQDIRNCINYEAIRALNPNGYNVQSDDGKNWEIVRSYPATKKILYHVNNNGTMQGPYCLIENQMPCNK